jgi:ribonuclease HII
VIVGLDDSKRLTARQRAVLVPHIFDAACAISVAFVGPQEIDRINILEASRLAMRLALERLAVNPDVVLTDAMAVGGPWQEWDLLKGDTRSATIAAASVIAKEVRDHYMAELAEEYPGYGFEGHKGYGTPSHRAALERLGCSPAHRRTFVDHWMAPDHEPGMQS